jgi:hypothetical protein
MKKPVHPIQAFFMRLQQFTFMAMESAVRTAKLLIVHLNRCDNLYLCNIEDKRAFFRDKRAKNECRNLLIC